MANPSPTVAQTGSRQASRKPVTMETTSATELTTLIATFGGRPIAAPALREVPLASNRHARDFAAALDAGDPDRMLQRIALGPGLELARGELPVLGGVAGMVFGILD